MIQDSELKFVYFEINSKTNQYLLYICRNFIIFNEFIYGDQFKT